MANKRKIRRGEFLLKKLNEGILDLDELAAIFLEQDQKFRFIRRCDVHRERTHEWYRRIVRIYFYALKEKGLISKDLRLLVRPHGRPTKQHFLIG